MMVLAGGRMLVWDNTPGSLMDSFLYLSVCKYFFLLHNYALDFLGNKLS